MGIFTLELGAECPPQSFCKSLSFPRAQGGLLQAQKCWTIQLISRVSTANLPWGSARRAAAANLASAQEHVCASPLCKYSAFALTWEKFVHADLLPPLPTPPTKKKYIKEVPDLFLNFSSVSDNFHLLYDTPLKLMTATAPQWWSWWPVWFVCVAVAVLVIINVWVWVCAASRLLFELATALPPWCLHESTNSLLLALVLRSFLFSGTEICPVQELQALHAAAFSHGKVRGPSATF